MNEHSTIGGNTLQLVDMGAGRGIVLNNLIKVNIKIFDKKKPNFICYFSKDIKATKVFSFVYILCYL